MRQGLALAQTAPALDLDEALTRCAGGDEAALRAVYEAEAGRMLGVALRLGQNASRALDEMRKSVEIDGRNADSR